MGELRSRGGKKERNKEDGAISRAYTYLHRSFDNGLPVYIRVLSLTLGLGTMALSELSDHWHLLLFETRPLLNTEDQDAIVSQYVTFTDKCQTYVCNLCKMVHLMSIRSCHIEKT